MCQIYLYFILILYYKYNLTQIFIITSIPELILDKNPNQIFLILGYKNIKLMRKQQSYKLQY